MALLESVRFGMFRLRSGSPTFADCQRVHKSAEMLQMPSHTSLMSPMQLGQAKSLSRKRVGVHDVQKNQASARDKPGKTSKQNVLACCFRVQDDLKHRESARP